MLPKKQTTYYIFYDYVCSGIDWSSAQEIMKVRYSVPVFRSFGLLVGLVFGLARGLECGVGLGLSSMDLRIRMAPLVLASASDRGIIPGLELHIKESASGPIGENTCEKIGLTHGNFNTLLNEETYYGYGKSKHDRTNAVMLSKVLFSILTFPSSPTAALNLFKHERGLK